MSDILSQILGLYLLDGYKPSAPQTPEQILERKQKAYQAGLRGLIKRRNEPIKTLQSIARGVIIVANAIGENEYLPQLQAIADGKNVNKNLMSIKKGVQS